MTKFIILSFILFHSFSLLSQNPELEELMQQDWPNMKKYRSQNEKILKKEFRPTAIFMGNSITEGWVNANPDFFETNNYIGRGIGGQTSPQMLLRFTPDVIDLKPQVVVILAGTNDIAGNTGRASTKMITDNIKAMAQLATANKIEVVLSSILPVYDYPWRKGLNPIETIAEVNAWLKNYAQENGHVYLDLFSAMANEQKGLGKEYSEDGVHPNKNGYSIMEPLVKEAIEKALQD